ncbi:MAG: hypothetical protein SCK70_07085 [bacterium]|nr:hypothetical protein [bacterium]
MKEWGPRLHLLNRRLKQTIIPVPGSIAGQIKSVTIQDSHSNKSMGGSDGNVGVVLSGVKMKNSKKSPITKRIGLY